MFPAIWQEIPSNVYTYKRRKSIKEEDIAICQCRPNSGGSCLENCINRILNIECTPVRSHSFVILCKLKFRGFVRVKVPVEINGFSFDNMLLLRLDVLVIKDLVYSLKPL